MGYGLFDSMSDCPGLAGPSLANIVAFASVCDWEPGSPRGQTGLGIFPRSPSPPVDMAVPG